MSYAKPYYGTKIAFTDALTAKVDTYFQNISKKADWRIYAKAFFLTFIHVALWYMAVFGNIPPPEKLLCWFLIGLITIPGGGFNIFHDGSHGSVSEKHWVNRLFAYYGNLVGIIEGGWDIQHNKLHHTHTNVVGHDNDISQGRLLRTSKGQPVQWYNKYQHIYCWFLYLFQSLYWIVWGDFQKARAKGGYIGSYKVSKKKIRSLRIEYVITKLFHIGVMIVLPIKYTGWTGVAGYFIAMITSGVVLALVFQMAHQVEQVQVFEVSEVIPNDWYVHELRTTANFKTNPLIEAFVGGLNKQVEHHLFRDISHIHYPKLSKIVKETCTEYGMPYHENSSFPAAIASHFRYMRYMGTATN